MSGIINSEGFRLNVGIVIINDKSQVLLARRHAGYKWQFPQGGIEIDETEEEALFRELQEEVGLASHQVEIVKKSQFWYSYRLPNRFLRPHIPGTIKNIGQTQKWFLLRMLVEESEICLNVHEHPEFDEWGWFDPSVSVEQSIYFKKSVYRSVIDEFFPIAG